MFISNNFWAESYDLSVTPHIWKGVTCFFGLGIYMVFQNNALLCRMAIRLVVITFLTLSTRGNIYCLPALVKDFDNLRVVDFSENHFPLGIEWGCSHHVQTEDVGMGTICVIPSCSHRSLLSRPPPFLFDLLFCLGSLLVGIIVPQ